MGFEVKPTGLRPGHPRRGIAAAVLIAVALIGAGLAARSLPGPELAGPSSVSGSPGAPSLVAAASPSVDAERAAPQGSARPLPPTLDCRDVTHDVCTRAATAAMGVLPDDLPAVSGATVWHSLLCSVLPDCPPQLLTRDSVPLGSVIVSFTDAGPEAWINVVEHETTLDGVAAPPIRAWIVRWH